MFGYNYEFVDGNKDLGVCPFCGSCAEGVVKENGSYYVVCDNPYCRATGSKCSKKEDAIKFWNGGSKK